jgi:hypothetical protein
MTTDAEIQKCVRRHQGFIPKLGWIAHVKEVHGVPTLRGATRARRVRNVVPCPPEKREAIEEALRHSASCDGGPAVSALVFVRGGST